MQERGRDGKGTDLLEQQRRNQWQEIDRQDAKNAKESNGKNMRTAKAQSGKGTAIQCSNMGTTNLH